MMLGLMLSVVLTQQPPFGEVECRGTTAGDVQCSLKGFRTLVDKALEARAEATKLKTRLALAEARLRSAEAALEEARTATPVAAPKVQAKPVVAVITAVIGAAALTTAALADSMDTTTRVSMGVVGAAAVTGGVVLVF